MAEISSQKTKTFHTRVLVIASIYSINIEHKDYWQCEGRRTYWPSGSRANGAKAHQHIGSGEGEM